jgi:hypothetical protein
VRNWLRKLFAPKIVEVDLSRPKLDPDARKSLTELRSHPGLTYLVARFRLQRWYLENQMRNVTFSTTREMDQVQLGARWLAWVERQIEEMLTVDTPKPRITDAEDFDSFEKARIALELVGQDQ